MERPADLAMPLVTTLLCAVALQGAPADPTASTDPAGTAEPLAARALLIGVADYANLSDDLDGPVHDVDAMEFVLTSRFGFPEGSIVRLTTGSGDPAPTAARIVEALDALAVAAEEEDLDFAVVFVAGHGTPVPDTSGDENDGADEAFLATDVDRWDPETATLPGAILDDQFSTRLQRIASAGCLVWFVADTCFSGTLERGGPTARFREVSSGSLGIPPITQRRDDRRVDSGVGEDALEDPERAGRLVAFSATRIGERAPEVGGRENLIDEDGPPLTYGYFSHTLCRELLREGGIGTFEDLIQSVHRSYDNDVSMEWCARPTCAGELGLDIPGHEGDSVGPAVFVKDRELRLNRGAVDHVLEGTRLVARDGSGEDVELKVERVYLFDALCVPVDPDLRVVRAFSREDPTPVRALTEPAGAFSLGVWITEASREARKEATESDGAWLRLVDQESDADWKVEEIEGADRYLLSPTSGARKAHRIRRGMLVPDLEQVYRARALTRLDRQPWVGHVPEGLECRIEVIEPDGSKFAAAPGQQPVPGSTARLLVRNESPDEWQVAAYGVNGDYRIAQLGTTQRFTPGSEWKVFRDRQGAMAPFFFYDDTCGAEAVVWIATRVLDENMTAFGQSGLTPFDGTTLEESGASRGGSTSRGPGGDVTGIDPSTSVGRLLDQLVSPSRSGSPTRYEDIDSFLVVTPYDLRWPDPILGRPLDAGIDPDAARIAQTLTDLPIPIPKVSGSAALAEEGPLDIRMLGGETAHTLLIDFEARWRKDGDERFVPHMLLSDTEQGWLAVYDTLGSRPGWDLALLDIDRDHVAERRWERGPEGWSALIDDARDGTIQIDDLVLPHQSKESRLALHALRETLFDAPPGAWGSAPANNLLESGRSGSVDPESGSGATPAMEAMLQSLAAELTPFVEVHPAYRGSIRVFLVDDDRPNATAGPDPTRRPIVKVHSGLVHALGADPAMVRAILAHEFAHLALGHAHPSRRPVAEFWSAEEVRHLFTRQQEFEADAFAARILEDAGHDRDHLCGALMELNRVQRHELDIGWHAGMAGTHSSPIQRVARISPTEDRHRALAAFELGQSMLECRRPQYALQAFRAALEIEPQMDEARFGIAHAQIRTYYANLPEGLRDRWLQPDFGPLLTLQDLGRTRGDTVTPADMRRYREAEAKVAELPTGVLPAWRALYRGTLEVLSPEGEREVLLRGVARLRETLDDRRLAHEGAAQLRRALARNAALGLHRLGRPEAEWQAVVAKVGGARDDAEASAAPPAEIELGGATIGLLDRLGPELGALGKADRDEPVSRDYDDFRMRTWGGEDDRTAVVALVERGTLLKLTSYLPGTAVHLRPEDSADPGDLRLEVGAPADAFYALVESAGLHSLDAIEASHLGRTAFDGPEALLEDETWTFVPALNLAALLVDDRVAALAVAPARPE
ncbi:MAG: caspase family protein [Planctomycetota bacterium]